MFPAPWPRTGPWSPYLPHAWTQEWGSRCAVLPHCWEHGKLVIGVISFFLCDLFLSRFFLLGFDGLISFEDEVLKKNSKFLFVSQLGNLLIRHPLVISFCEPNGVHTLKVNQQIQQFCSFPIDYPRCTDCYPHFPPSRLCDSVLPARFFFPLQRLTSVLQNVYSSQATCPQPTLDLPHIFF